MPAERISDEQLLAQRRPGTGLGLRKQIFRLSWIRGHHYYVLFGWPLVRLSRRSRYLKLRDLERSDTAGPPARSTLAKAPAVAESDPTQPPYYLTDEVLARPTVDAMLADLSRYDVISFDIFDTAVHRSVDSPADVFRIMAARTGVGDYVRLRRSSEAYARIASEQSNGSREVTLSDIYSVLNQRHGISPEWAQTEADLEVDLARPNPYVLALYEALRAMGKRTVFMTDMYLPRATIEQILERSGYTGYDKLYLSHEHKKRKGDGTLQKVLLDDCAAAGQTVVHVGDSLHGDVQKSEEAGLDAVYHPDQRGIVREADMNGLAGSVYRAVIGNTMANGTWEHGLHYTHGYRVGGILALGFCEFLERSAAQKGIDKILFCGRDCDVIFRLYRQHYAGVASGYIDVSRYALFGITLDRNFSEYIGRSFFRAFRESENSKPLFQVMTETGFDYLIPLLEDTDIEKFVFASSIQERKLETFFWAHRAVIEEHNAAGLSAAREYFAEQVGDAKRILVVDIGWAGTSANVLRHFITTQLGGSREVFGALMCPNRDESVSDAIGAGWLECYGYSPLENLDLARTVMPSDRVPVRVTDRIHLALEYLFTEARPTVSGYGRDSAGRPIAVRGTNQPPNVDQIAEIQEGILDFASTYLDYAQFVDGARRISSYVAMRPLTTSLSHPQYLYDVYKDFLYDATPALFGQTSRHESYGALFDVHSSIGATADPKKSSRGKILFVSPEMVYAGAPRSLLRMCKVALDLGYEPVVWTAKAGPFISEYQAVGLEVRVVPPAGLNEATVQALVTDDVRLAVCNSVVTDAYVRALEGVIPLVWYIREAANLPDFYRSSPERVETVAASHSIYSVSEYAAAALARYARHPISVIRNSVEDVSALALPFRPVESGGHRFVQLGTIEHRKGYDLLVAAFKMLPASYRDRAELHFAGGFINSGSSFASYVFAQASDEPHIHYHGLITDESEKIGLLSQMDTVVVASRDESCSLVALEGAMLSKPLIVTENVGAKYIVDDTNGLVVRSGSVEALRDAFMQMIDRRESDLVRMGKSSRQKYEQVASMTAYRDELEALFAAKAAERPKGRGKPILGAAVRRASAAPSVVGGRQQRPEPLLVSLTSFPPRMPFVAECIESLLQQTLAADKVVLWLSEDQFPGREQDLPADLLALVGGSFTIAWVAGDLGPHKKYFYAAQRYPDHLLITVDDDVVYHERLVEYLYEAHLEQPRAIICQRANFMLFRPDGQRRRYDSWIYDCQFLRGTRSYQLLPTGVGGVLYPIGSLPAEAFDEAAIRATCLYADDLWLKVMTTANGYPVWMPRRAVRFTPLEDAQSVGLWRTNSIEGENDTALDQILNHVAATYAFDSDLLRRIRGIGPDGELLAPEELGSASLFDSALKMPDHVG